MMKRVAFLMVVLASLLVAGCGSSGAGSPATASAEGARKTYADVESLRRDSFFVFEGLVVLELERSVDRGGSAGGGIPMVYYAVEIVALGKATKSVADPSPCPRAGIPKICLAWADRPDLPALRPGQHYVFFLESLNATQAPGLERTLTPIYVPIGGIAGVFEREDSRARPLDRAIIRLGPGQASAEAFSVSELLGQPVPGG